MAKFPTDVDESVSIAAPRERVYAYLWDVVGSSHCVPDLATCDRVGPDTYSFVSRERSADSGAGSPKRGAPRNTAPERWRVISLPANSTSAPAPVGTSTACRMT